MKFLKSYLFEEVLEFKAETFTGWHFHYDSWFVTVMLMTFYRCWWQLLNVGIPSLCKKANVSDVFHGISIDLSKAEIDHFWPVEGNIDRLNIEMNLISHNWKCFQNWIIIWTSLDIEYAETRLTTSGTRLHQNHYQSLSKFFTRSLRKFFYRSERTKFSLLWLKSSKSIKFSKVPLAV